MRLSDIPSMDPNMPPHIRGWDILATCIFITHIYYMLYEMYLVSPP
jgi:hypothetical protein